MMIAQICKLGLGDLIQVMGDTHLYLNHLNQTRLQLTREPYPLPMMKINPEVASIFDFKYEDFELINYQSHPYIKAEISV
jgi:thymidylate synthase